MTMQKKKKKKPIKISVKVDSTRNQLTQISGLSMDRIGSKKFEVTDKSNKVYPIFTSLILDVTKNKKLMLI